MDKNILLASFIFPERLDWFVNDLGEKFGIASNKIFCYKNTNDESRVIVTYKITVPEGERLDIKNLFPNAVIIHKKGNALYTINELNKLIETKVGSDIGNIDYRAYKLDWNEYQNKLILIDNKELALIDILRIF